ncbi:VOC family protein [Neobacillus sp. SuZ13]|uniref:VOC family protein n=1 Tax=Neobacillus sp. SuZ13 TaxID=3047875 RepID=UPI0024BFA357|nr:VOC family protein [Neobacillus sp. SuZ13]WHY66125.1 VOC family protein [Neobacillus sp. SuZ13]
MAVKKMDHVGVMVNDLDASLRFYQEIVGLALKDRFTIANGTITLAFLGFQSSDETELELVYGGNGDLPAEGKVNHVAFLVDDIEEEFDRLKGVNVVFISDEIVTLPNGYRNFFVQGPDGEKVEFFQR